MKDVQPQPVYLKDYRVPDFFIEETKLTFDLQEEFTRVVSKLVIRRNPEANNNNPLVLQGQDLKLEQVSIDNVPKSLSDYRLDDQLNGQSLIINIPDQCQLSCTTIIDPENNTSLEGLYQSSSMYCTQCEAEGFRKITFYLDRPDVMSVFTTKIIADQTAYPVLLSNGNLIDSGILPAGRHWVKWHDPFKKPAYLFALVAGDLAFIEDYFTTCSSRRVTIRIYVESKDLDKCDHAVNSLKKAMKWDEQVYGREYDLDIFMIVAVDHFNMGAMENKGLNIFNTSCVLANPKTATDADFQRIEAIVAHEYFHNWSGNRVTCRDWFQLSLKEGFTVFRDAEFSADMGSRPVKRIEDATLLRTLQFAEDAGPMRHPVQPSSYIEISNFYTLTVYEKGAEVVRMLSTLIGSVLFRKGSDLYFQRHDGQAVTIDEFIQAMADASSADLTQFKHWYTQAGTPSVEVTGKYDPDSYSYQLTLTQSCEDSDQPFHIPFAVGLVGESGCLPLNLSDNNTSRAEDKHFENTTTDLLELTRKQQTFIFIDVMEKPVPSLLRKFSAPVRVHYDYSRNDYLRLMAKDDDAFCQWDAGQQLAVSIIGDLVQMYNASGDTAIKDNSLHQGFKRILENPSLDKAMMSLMLTLPSEAYLSEIATIIDVDAIHHARSRLKESLANEFKALWWQLYSDLSTDRPYTIGADDIARRSLKNTALSYLMLLDDDSIHQCCYQQLGEADNMTDVMAALTAVCHSPLASVQAERERILDGFYQKWRHENLVINRWLQVQATAPDSYALDNVKRLMHHDSFDIKNPNKVRSLIGAFTNANAINFHQESGKGYAFLGEQIMVINDINPQIAARMLTPLTRWKKYSSARQLLMKQALERILNIPNLSKDVYEIASKSMQP